jgi:cytochrome c peroxidase
VRRHHASPDGGNRFPSNCSRSARGSIDRPDGVSRLAVGCLVIAMALSLACRVDLNTPNDNDELLEGPSDTALVDSVDLISAEVRGLAGRNGYNPRRNRNPATPALVELGRALAFDKILSGDRQVSCMTCHLPSLATTDGKHLSVGVGGVGLGQDRTHPDGIFIPRNAPPLLNLDEVANTMFWDGRVQIQNGVLQSPAGDQITDEMRRVFRFGAVSVQPMFPVLSREEMRGQAGNNELADISDNDMTAIWQALMARLGAIDEYRTMFEAAYPGIPFDEMTFAHAANAIAGFLISDLAFDDSRWDRFMRGNNRSASLQALRGARAFFRTGCAACHRGSSFTDQRFHNTGLPQIGPGKGDGPSGRDDFGRAQVTEDPADQWAFRTAPLRNIELTAPYGHAGQFVDLLDFVDHYDSTAAELREYDPSQLEPALQGTLLDNFDAIPSTLDERLQSLVFDERTTELITAFLLTLTDEEARDLSHIVPPRVPSGLPIDGRP